MCSQLSDALTARRSDSLLSPHSDAGDSSKETPPSVFLQQWELHETLQLFYWQPRAQLHCILVKPQWQIMLESAYK